MTIGETSFKRDLIRHGKRCRQRLPGCGEVKDSSVQKGI